MSDPARDSSLTETRPDRPGHFSIEPFEGSRPDLAGQLLIGYFNWIRDTRFGIVATRSLSRHIAVALPNIITRSVRRAAASFKRR